MMPQRDVGDPVMQPADQLTSMGADGNVRPDPRRAEIGDHSLPSVAPERDPNAGPLSGSAAAAPISAPAAPRANDGMRVLSRMQQDLDILTEGKRAATYAEVDDAFDNAVKALGLKLPIGHSHDRGPVIAPIQATPTELAEAPLKPAIPEETMSQTRQQQPERVSVAPATPNSAPDDPDILSADTLDELRAGARAENLFNAPTLSILSELAGAEGDNIGYLSEKYESAGRGPGTISNPGTGDPGGISYGTYQLSTRQKTLQAFLKSPENLWPERFVGLEPLTPAFDKVWKDIASKERDAFSEAQYAFIYQTNYLPTIATVAKATGVDLDAMSNAVREAAFSTSVQHGLASIPLTRAVEAAAKSPGTGKPTYEEELIKQIYIKRAEYVADVARKARSASVKKQLQTVIDHRYPNERTDALARFNTVN